MNHKKKMIYKSIERKTQEDAEEVFEYGDAEDIALVLYGIIDIGDSDWLVNTYKRFLEHEEKWVVNAAITNIGYLPRYYKIDTIAHLVGVLEEMGRKKPEYQGRIDDALSDIEVFRKKTEK